MGDPHPIAWYIEDDEATKPLVSGAPKSGRSFYTSLGHANETWRDALFQNHLFGGLTWALNGASTQAYRVGVVGNTSEPPPPEPTTSAPQATAPTAVQAAVQDGGALMAIPSVGAVVMALFAFLL